MKLPDIIGRTMGQAEEILRSAGVPIYSVVVTSPPKQPQEHIDSSFRVIRSVITDKGAIELTVCKPL